MASKLLSFVLCFLLLLSSGCGKKPKKSNTKKTLQTVILSPSDLQLTKLQPIADTFQATGELKPSLESVVSGEVEGVALAVYVEEGDYVKKGQVLAKLNSKDLNDQLRNTRENLQKTVARADLAKISLDRKQQAYSEDLVSKQDLDTASTDRQVSLREVESAHTQVSLAQTAITKANVRAPINGIVSKKLLKTGELAQPGKSLFEIVQINPLKVELNIPSKYLSALHIGASLKLSIPSIPGESFTAKITKINPVADEVTRAIIVTAEVANPANKLKANLFVNSQLTLPGSRQGVVIPQSAIVKDVSGRQTVYVFDRQEGIARRIPIVAEATDNESLNYEVKEGLETGQELILVPLNTDADEVKAKVGL